MTVHGLNPYPDDCSGPPDIEEYDGPPIIPAAVIAGEDSEPLDRPYWEAVCPSCGRPYSDDSCDVARQRAEDCWARHQDAAEIEPDDPEDWRQL